MNDVPLSTFEQAIRATHGAKAKLAERVHVDERFEGEPVWQGGVLVFELLDHPSAKCCWRGAGGLTNQGREGVDPCGWIEDPDGIFD